MQRREFLATTPALLSFPLHLRPRQKSAPFRIAVIGTGWYGKMDLFRLLQIAQTEVVGLCDVDRKQLEHADTWLRKRHPEQQPRLYADHRELLAKEKPDIALIETPDHWHALQAIDCLKAGCHLYLQKPVGVDIRECEAILDAARQYDRIVQVALQRRSTPHLVEAKKKYLDSGLIGEVHHVEMCCYYHMRDRQVREVRPVPDHFDYERWTGPAPLLPFRGIPHRRWRSFQEYGNGIMGDMCVHYYDAVRWLLGLGWPARVSSQGGIYVDTAADATTTDTQSAVFEHPERGLNCVWQHRAWGQAPDPEWPWSFTLYGSEGKLQADTHKYEWTARKGAAVRVAATDERERYPEDVDEKDIELLVAPATRAHLRDFLAAIDLGQPPVADIEEGYISTAACVLANMAMEVGRPLTYDPVRRELVGEALGLARAYRGGYWRG
ncbi:MAG: Gfo/Idh/MocA family oxidoreductase [Bacteroidota bacterium]